MDMYALFSILFSIGIVFSPQLAGAKGCKNLGGLEYCTSSGTENISVGPFLVTVPKNWTFHRILGEHKNGREVLEMTPDRAKLMSESSKIISVTYFASRENPQVSIKKLESLKERKNAHISDFKLQDFLGKTARYEEQGNIHLVSQGSKNKEFILISLIAPKAEFTAMQEIQNSLFAKQ